MTDEIPKGFCWDFDKDEANLAKHGISFADAVQVFDAPTYDVANVSHAEIRIAATGLVHGLEVTVVFTVRGQDFRIISARRAKSNERARYWEYVRSLSQE
jgi:uncharacterized protein